jgi:hypothetical protein
MSHPQCVGREALGAGQWVPGSAGIDLRDLVGIFWLLGQPLRLGQSPSLLRREMQLREGGCPIRSAVGLGAG